MTITEAAQRKANYEKAKLEAAIRKVVETSGSPQAIEEYLRVRGFAVPKPTSESVRGIVK